MCFDKSVCWCACCPSVWEQLRVRQDELMNGGDDVCGMYNVYFLKSVSARCLKPTFGELFSWKWMISLTLSLRSLGGGIGYHLRWTHSARVQEADSYFSVSQLSRRFVTTKN